MSLDGIQLLQLFQSFLLLKIAFLVVIFLYVIFAFIIIRQVNLMNRIIRQSPVGGILSLIAWLHFLAALSLFFFALAIL